ncbi:DUF3987 domain-containing protein [Vibrio cyclitrophicus]|uniref:DUF3987 domain-containing protein n=1 Tax=Vibrio cyclitrophicus TaxID=47951 RepID=UPI0011B54FD3|nr:DUF3987 domain-containing protein [Vibrio cyclitrophicus]
MIKILSKAFNKKDSKTYTVDNLNDVSTNKVTSKRKSKNNNDAGNTKGRDVPPTSLTQPQNGLEQEESIVKIRPYLPPEGRYGILSQIATALSRGTEAHFEAIVMTLMSILSISIPRDRKVTPFGAGVTEHRLNLVMLARTGEGKGLSDDQVSALIDTANKLAGNNDSCGFPLYAPITSGGLASGEGLSNHLRDTNTPEDDDKRLVMIEAEFQSVLSKCNAKDSILSATIRKLFDGKTLTSMTKSDPYTCTDPHVAIVGHITPKEFSKELSNSSVTNGFANRFPIYRLFGKEGEAFPHTTKQVVLDELAEQLNEILYWANSDNEQLEFTECYKERYKAEYKTLRSLGPNDSVEQSLMTRASHYATMYAMMFAICDKTNQVNENHLNAALAWIEYWHSSVRYTFNTEREAHVAERKEQMADIVLAAIKTLCEQGKSNQITRTPLKNYLGRAWNSKLISESLITLQERPIPAIKVTRGQHNKHTIILLE